MIKIFMLMSAINIYKGILAYEFDVQDFENAFPGYDNVKSAKVIHDLFSRKFDALALLKRLE